MKVINVTPEMTVLPLGRLGENERTQFVFDVSEWLEEYPGATIGLANQLPHTKDSYACTITREGDGKYSWTITSAELTTEGDGKCQLQATSSGVVVKGKIYKTKIGEALDGEADPPDPWESWITDLTELKEDAEDAAEDAADSAEDAEAWAVGKRGGEDVGIDDPTHENNAKYYAEHVIEAIQDEVDAWLDDHPEATTTVQEYLTPEMFGAKGDGTTDDTTAIQNCISAAISGNKAIRGYNQYKVTSTIELSGNYMDVDIRRITYTGESYGLSISGTYNKINVNYLHCANGKGIVMMKTAAGSCTRNRITVNRLYAKGHGVSFSTASGMVLYNTFDIRVIKSDNGDCYHGDQGSGENVFLNTTCECENGWAIYNCHGRFYNFTMEENVLNGICNCYGYFAGFRVREMVDKLVARINGTFPNEQGGTLIKFSGHANGVFRYESEDYIPYSAIDVSEAESVDDIIAETYFPSTRAANLSLYKIIDAPIRYGNWDTQNGYIVPAKRMIIVGNRKICIPAYQTVCTITSADYDMRDAQAELNNAQIYPTRMIIGVDNCVIHLSASYCSYGYSEFIVDQTKGHLCTIYDENSDSTPIFNGSTLGAGIYKLKAYCDPYDNIIANYRQGGGPPSNDSTNYKWEIRRIDSDGYSVCVDDFGAVGDGTTDDSAAIRAAIACGYAVRFASNKTYYVASQIDIDHDVKLYGGENTVIKTKTPSGGIVNNAFVVSGTLKKTTTLTTDYTVIGNTANCGNKFTLTDMTNINIGDIMVITASDQYYSYARAYYYRGATLLISDIYDSHLYTTDTMPLDIENTENVSVTIYSAPTVIFENLNFVSDLDSVGKSRYFIVLKWTKNCTIRNCNMTQMSNGLEIYYSVNTLVDCLTVSKSKYDNVQITGDGYGIGVYSSSNTVIQRVISLCSQGCIDLGGFVPNMNTYIRHCNLASECRQFAIDLHENSYNLVVEDCVLGGLAMHGPAHVNRCKFIQNKRYGSSLAVAYYGSHIKDLARVRIENCEFGSNTIQLESPSPQDPIQSFDCVWGSVVIENCTGGSLLFLPTISATITSNTAKNITLKNWKNCKEIRHTAGTSGYSIDYLGVTECTFTEGYWINSADNQVNVNGIEYLSVHGDNPKKEMLFVDLTKNGGTYDMPEDIPIAMTSSNTNAHYVVCGENIASNDPDDYTVGSVSGDTGETLTRTANSAFASSLSTDASGHLVFTQHSSNTSKVKIFPKCMTYVDEPSVIKTSCVIKNTGATDGASFRVQIAVIDCATGKVTYNGIGTSGTASASGVTITHTRGVPANSLVISFLACSAVVLSSGTTFEDYVTMIKPHGFADTVAYKTYDGSSRDGNGTLNSVEGINYVMTNAASFDAKFKVDYLR